MLSTFLYLAYLFIRLNISVCMLMIYKWSKIRVYYAFWLNMIKIQPWNLLERIATPFFWILSYFYSFLGLVYEIIYKIYYVYIIYFISHSLWSFNGIAVGFPRSISEYQNAPWKRLDSMWFVWRISAFWSLFSVKGWGVPTLFWVKKSPFHVSLNLVLVL